MPKKLVIEMGRTACGRERIRRRGYRRRDGTRVPPTCIRDRGKPGKTPKGERWLPKDMPKLRGWKKTKPQAERMRALKRVTRQQGCRRIGRTMIAISNVTTDLETKKKLRDDYKKLKKQPWCHLKTKGR